MSCGELGKGAKTGEEVKVCCGEFETCREMCVVRADRFKSQRDELLAEFNAYKEGSEEAFGTVVAQKQAAEARLQMMQSTIASQQGVICDFREQRDKLLAALEKFIAWNKAYPSSRIYSATAIRVIAKELDQIADQAEAAIASVKGGSE